jgi:uncharacterized protein (TIGR02646 family)
MIQLKKNKVPDVLQNHADEWTRSLLDSLASGTVTDTQKSRYRDPAIKKALIDETSGKCAYCEAKILHVTFGDIEHIRPKSISPELTFQWNNLTLACDVCNTNKSNKFPNGVGLINPYECDPSEHFHFLGPLLIAKAGDQDAQLTERILKLNRAELVIERTRKINSIRELLEIIMLARADLKDALMSLLPDEVSPKQEYSGAASAALSVLLNTA